jgi:serine phosphatase RsbU (regulator of sigma subunit)
MATAEVAAPATRHGSGNRRDRPDRRRGPDKRRGSHWLPLAVLLVGGLLTAALTWAAATANTNTNHRLLTLQVRQAGSVLSSLLPSAVTPLTTAYDVASATRDQSQFKDFISPDVGPVGLFASASLWQVVPGPPKPLVIVGAPPLLLSAGNAASFFGRVRPGGKLIVMARLTGATRRIGYAEIPAGEPDTVVVYAETPLPANKKAVVPKNSAFSDLQYALYLGARQDAASLVEGTGPLSGYRARASFPFGDRTLTLVGTTTAPLGGGLSATLPLIAALLGAALTASAAVTTEYLVRRRRLAEGEATENASLYAEERTISETLQRSLLPEGIEQPAGLDVAVRYVPGVGGIEVGGDWYDVIPTGDGTAFFVVGDVSGRGLHAATSMGYLRHAIRAYAALSDGPGALLTKLGDLMGRDEAGHFATVLCAHVDVPRHLLRVACAGHFAPLVIDGQGARYLEVDAGPPIGVTPRADPVETTVTVAPGTSVLAFTDGLIERRGENLDLGLARLRHAVGAVGTKGAAGGGVDIDHLVGEVLRRLTPVGSDDDIAILGVQWQA